MKRPSSQMFSWSQEIQICISTVVTSAHALPYVALVLFNLALRLVPSTDIRSATSVVFLGPLTFLRPFVMIVGVAFGLWRAQLRATTILGLFVLALMLSLEFALNLYNGKLQERQIRSLI